MSTADVLACSKSILASKQARDAAVRLLNLDAPPPAPWAIDVPNDDRLDDHRDDRLEETTDAK